MRKRLNTFDQKHELRINIIVFTVRCRSPEFYQHILYIIIYYYHGVSCRLPNTSTNNGNIYLYKHLHAVPMVPIVSSEIRKLLYFFLLEPITNIISKMSNLYP